MGICLEIMEFLVIKRMGWLMTSGIFIQCRTMQNISIFNHVYISLRGNPGGRSRGNHCLAGWCPWDRSCNRWGQIWKAGKLHGKTPWKSENSSTQDTEVLVNEPEFHDIFLHRSRCRALALVNVEKRVTVARVSRVIRWACPEASPSFNISFQVPKEETSTRGGVRTSPTLT